MHVSTAAFKFGTAVFEGLRGYWNEQQRQMYLFQMDAHMKRLEFSQKFMRFDKIFDADYVKEKTIELLRANEFQATVHSMTTVFVDGFGGPTVAGRWVWPSPRPNAEGRDWWRMDAPPRSVPGCACRITPCPCA